MERKESKSGGSPDPNKFRSPDRTPSKKADDEVAGTSTRATARTSTRKTPTKPARMKDDTASAATAGNTASQPDVTPDSQTECSLLRACATDSSDASRPADLMSCFPSLCKRSGPKEAKAEANPSLTKLIENSVELSGTAGPSTKPPASPSSKRSAIHPPASPSARTSARHLSASPSARTTAMHPAASPSARTSAMHPAASPSARISANLLASPSASTTTRTYSTSATASRTAGRISVTDTASNTRSQSAGPTTRTPRLLPATPPTIRRRLPTVPPTISMDLPSPGSPPSNIYTPTGTSARSNASPHVSPSGKSSAGNRGSPSAGLRATPKSGSASPETSQQFLNSPSRLTRSNATSPNIRRRLPTVPPTISIELPTPGSPPSNIYTPSISTSARSGASPHVSPSGKSSAGNRGSPSAGLTATPESGSASPESSQQFLNTTPPRLTRSNATSPTVPFGSTSPRKSSSLSTGTSSSVPVSPSAARSRTSGSPNLPSSLPASTSNIKCSTNRTDSDRPEPMYNLNRKDLNYLYKLYSENESCIPNARSTIKRLIYLFSMPLPSHMEFAVKVPDDDYKKNGAIFVTMKYGDRYEVGIYTLGEEGMSTIYSGLIDTRRIRFSRLTVLKDIHPNVYLHVMKALRHKKLIIKSDKKFFIYTLSIEKAQNFKLKVPDDVEVKPILHSQAAMVNITWSDSYPQSERYIEALIRMNGGYVVISKRKGRFVSWILKSAVGQIAVMETNVKYRRKGYASLVVKYLAKEIAGEGHPVVAFVPEENNGAQKLFLKLGFSRQKGESHDIEVWDPNEVHVEDA